MAAPVRDEYGTPYIRLPGGYPQCKPGQSVTPWTMTQPCSKNYAGWDMLYRPRFPPRADYDAWPERLREWIPREWSGDATTKPIRNGLTVAETDDPANLVRNQYIFELEWNYQNRDFLAFYATHFLHTLADNGWGRYWHVLSDVTGEEGSPFVWGSTLTIKTTFDVGAFFAGILRAIAKVVSFIPGIGTVAASILAGVGALAAGENIGAALLDAAANAVPGGGIAKDALKTGVEMAKTLIEGGSLGEAVLAGARKALETQGVPVEVLTAFDIGAALGTGKGLQEAGFKALGVFVPGGDALQKGLNYTKAIARATADAVPVFDVLVNSLANEVAKVPVAGLELAPVIDMLKAQPYLMAFTSDAIAEAAGVPEVIARAAQAILRDGKEDEALRRRLLMTADERGFEKYGSQWASVDFAPSFRDELEARRLLRSAIEDDRLSFKSQYAAQQAALMRAATINPGTTFKAQYEAIYGPTTPPPVHVAREPVKAPLVQQAPAPVVAAPRHSLAGDLALGGLIAAAGVALVLFVRREA